MQAHQLDVGFHIIEEGDVAHNIVLFVYFKCRELKHFSIGKVLATS